VETFRCCTGDVRYRSVITGYDDPAVCHATAKELQGVDQKELAGHRITISTVASCRSSASATERKWQGAVPPPQIRGMINGFLQGVPR
jgi:hypothetical protein